MATITEDYVSFETAKMLKEKGFDSKCKYVWKLDKTSCKQDSNGISKICSEIFMEGESSVDNNDIKLVFEYNGWSESSHEVYLCPTLQMAMKWLRKKFNIVISIIFISDQKREDRNSYSWIVYTADTFKWNTKEAEKSQVSYELACESAIKYCLENLI